LTVKPNPTNCPERIILKPPRVRRPQDFIANVLPTLFKRRIYRSRTVLQQCPPVTIKSVDGKIKRISPQIYSGRHNSNIHRFVLANYYPDSSFLYQCGEKRFGLARKEIHRLIKIIVQKENIYINLIALVNMFSNLLADIISNETAVNQKAPAFQLFKKLDDLFGQTAQRKIHNATP